MQGSADRREGLQMAPASLRLTLPPGMTGEEGDAPEMDSGTPPSESAWEDINTGDTPEPAAQVVDIRLKENQGELELAISTSGPDVNVPYGIIQMFSNQGQNAPRIARVLVNQRIWIDYTSGNGQGACVSEDYQISL